MTTHQMRMHVPICKVDEEKRLVYGIMTQEVKDHSGEVLDYEGSRAEFEKWSANQYAASGGKSYGNVREMHTSIAAGRLNQPIEFDDASKAVMACAYVGDDQSWQKVQDGILTGFSIGGNYLKRWADPSQPGVTRYIPELVEVSLVDAPCVPTATFEYIKANGETEIRKFVTTKGEAPTMAKKDTAAKAAAPATTEAPATEEAAPAEEYQLVQKWHAKDGSTWDKKEDARKRNAQVDAEAVAAAAAAPALEALQALNKTVDAAAGDGAADAAAEPAPAAGGGEQTPAADAAAQPEPAAAAEAGAGEGGEATKAAEGTLQKRRLAKGMGDVCDLACIIRDLHWLQVSLTWETSYEGDNSALPAEARAAVELLCTLLEGLVREETQELLASEDKLLEDVASGVFKALEGSKLAELVKLAPAMETVAKAIGEKQTAAAAEAQAAETAAAEGQSPELAKANGDVQRLGAENAALTKALADLTPQISELQKRLEKVEAQPQTPKGAVRVVHKGGEAQQPGGSGDAADDVVKSLAAMTPDQRNMVVMKAALAAPQIMAPGAK